MRIGIHSGDGVGVSEVECEPAVILARVRTHHPIRLCAGHSIELQDLQFGGKHPEDSLSISQNQMQIDWDLVVNDNFFSQFLRSPSPDPPSPPQTAVPEEIFLDVEEGFPDLSALDPEPT